MARYIHINREFEDVWNGEYVIKRTGFLWSWSVLHLRSCFGSFGQRGRISCYWAFNFYMWFLRTEMSVSKQSIVFRRYFSFQLKILQNCPFASFDYVKHVWIGFNRFESDLTWDLAAIVFEVLWLFDVFSSKLSALREMHRFGFGFVFYIIEGMDLKTLISEHGGRGRHPSTYLPIGFLFYSWSLWFLVWLLAGRKGRMYSISFLHCSLHFFRFLNSR